MLTATVFYMMITIIAKFDLEIRQLNVVNVFVNIDLDKMVYIYYPPGFKKGSTG